VLWSIAAIPGIGDTVDTDLRRPELGEEDRMGPWRCSKPMQGAKPGDLPVEQATKFQVLIDLKTANAPGITVLPLVLARADEVIR